MKIYGSTARAHELRRVSASENFIRFLVDFMTQQSCSIVQLRWVKYARTVTAGSRGALKVPGCLNPPVRHERTRGRDGVRSFDRRCLGSQDAAGVEVRKEMKAAREHAGPRLARRVSGEWRAPATSQRPIRTANDAGTTRALLAPMLSALLSHSSCQSSWPLLLFSCSLDRGCSRPSSSHRLPSSLLALF